MLKSIHKAVLAVIIVLGLFIGSCVEEPTIAPVKIPFTMMRFGNMLANIENIDVYVDGELKASNLAQNQFSEFMQITSVKRKLEIKNSANDDVLYSKTIDAVSYDEMSVYPAAYYSSNIDSTTMAVLFHTEGATYHVEEPPAGKAHVYFMHGAGDTPTDSTRGLDLYATLHTDTADVDTLLTPQVYCEGPNPCGNVAVGGKLESYFIKFSEVGGFSLPPGEYDFRMTMADLNGDETDSIMTSLQNITINEGTRNYIYLSGPMTDLKISFEERMPLPALSK